MIWFFDSWFWWLQTMKYFHDLYPYYDYIFLADNKNCPFGHRSWPEIEKITFNALNWLFDNRADIVIIACNTAAAYSIRKRQSLYPDKKTLSITVPWVEQIISNYSYSTGFSEDASVWIIATQATVRSDIYIDLYSRFWWKWSPDFHFVMAPKLVDMVESWINDKSQIKHAITKYLLQFPKDITTLILWCTHFSVYKAYFDELFDWIVVDPSFYSAQKFDKYLKSHWEIENKLSKNSTTRFYTTWDTDSFDKIWFNICNKQIISKKISI
jgi:glutamate racemase